MPGDDDGVPAWKRKLYAIKQGEELPPAPRTKSPSDDGDSAEPGTSQAAGGRRLQQQQEQRKPSQQQSAEALLQLLKATRHETHEGPSKAVQALQQRPPPGSARQQTPPQTRGGRYVTLWP
jgi:hypothetical protein